MQRQPVAATRPIVRTDDVVGVTVRRQPHRAAIGSPSLALRHPVSRHGRAGSTITAVTLTAPASRPGSDRPLWLAYAGLCLLCWALYVMAGTDWQRGAWHMEAAAGYDEYRDSFPMSVPNQ